ncbi:MAG TPA: DUF2399 domain-containing protein [Rhodocyclaceae bacterium]|nr:DUF2399 domain-containing protein [Rhodocyclaceae bacterium]
MDWSPPDADGLSSLRLDDPLRVSLKGQRRLRRGAPAPLDVDAWPREERELLAAWVRQAGERPIRHDTLLRAAGPSRAAMADRLVHTLLRAGAVEVEEHGERGLWRLRQLRFLAPAELRRALGLPEPDAERTAWVHARGHVFTHPALAAAATVLDALPPARALARHALLRALDTWQADGRSGTWRDFSHFARGSTKLIGDSERAWLAAHLTLADFRLDDHTPLLLLRTAAELRLGDTHLTLAAIPDFVALSPDTLRQITGAASGPAVWFVVENRSSFERVARACGPDEGALWLPGYPPGSWRASVAGLLRHLPAPARIACDPDPDGILIACQAGTLWTAAGLDWTPWRMDAADFDALKTTRPLTERDRKLLDSLLHDPTLPAPLAHLAKALATRGAKGEQEAYL